MRGSKKVGKGWLDVTRIYERSYFTRLTSCEDSLLVGSANVEGNDEGMKEDKNREARIRKCTSCRIYRVYQVYLKLTISFLIKISSPIQ